MKYKGLYITLFVLTVMLLALPAVQQQGKLFKFEPLHGVSETVSRPELTVKSFVNGAYQTQEDQYLSENIGFREPMIRYYNQLTWSLFRKTHNKTLFINDDNWIFNDYSVKQYYGQSVYDFADSDEASVNKMNHDVNLLYQFQTLMNEYGVSFFVCLAPEKGMVYAEQVPKMEFDRPTCVRAIDYYPPLFDSLSINYINFSDYFLQIKDTVSYPLYLKTSSHWSNLSATYMADTLFHYMESISGLNLHNPSYGQPYFAPTRVPDADLEYLLNLVFPFDSSENQYVDVTLDNDSTAVTPIWLIVGDSYFWNWQYCLPLGQIFKTCHYWYYNNTIYNDSMHNHVSQADILRELLSTDIVTILYSPCNLYDLNLRFLSKALCSFYFEDDVIEAKLEELRRAIRNTPEWYASVERQASNKGLTIEEEIEINAEFTLYSAPWNYFEELNEAKVPACRNSRVKKVLSEIHDPVRDQYRYHIYNNPNWLNSIKEKAEAAKITFEEALERDITWMIENSDQE